MTFQTFKSILMNIKTSITITFSIALLLLSHAVKGFPVTDSLYVRTLQSAVENLDTVSHMHDLLRRKGLFERLQQRFPTEWLPLYYKGYTSLSLCYNDPKGTHSNLLFTDIFNTIQLLKKSSDAEQSEIFTLEGYYYMALIRIDPASQGKKYFRKVVTAFEKAIDLNPKNPRPICLLAFFEQQLPQMFRSKRNPIDEHQKAKILFENESKNTVLPHWGQNYLELIRLNL